MTDVLKNLWVLPILRGILVLLFCAFLFVYPGLSLVLLLIFFSAFTLITGVFTFIMAFTARRHQDALWKIYIIDATINIIIGLFVLFWPGLTSLILVNLIAIWALVSSFIQLFHTIKLRHYFTNIWLSLLAGIFLAVFALGLFAYPVTSIVAIYVIIGTITLIYGILSITFGVQLRKAISFS